METPAREPNASRHDMITSKETNAVTPVPVPENQSAETNNSQTSATEETNVSRESGSASYESGSGASSADLAQRGTNETRHQMNTEEELNTGEPQIRPLTSWEEVLAWQMGRDQFNVASVELAPAVPRPVDTPKTLLCHDMAGTLLQYVHILYVELSAVNIIC